VEYRAEHAQGCAYSWFCERYRDQRRREQICSAYSYRATPRLYLLQLSAEEGARDPTRTGDGLWPHTEMRGLLAKLLVAKLSRSGFLCTNAHSAPYSPYFLPQTGFSFPSSERNKNGSFRRKGYNRSPGAFLVRAFRCRGSNASEGVLTNW
jgi:hypothetical protein